MEGFPLGNGAPPPFTTKPKIFTIMAENKNMFWSRIINIVITVLTAIATTFGLNQFQKGQKGE